MARPKSPPLKSAQYPRGAIDALGLVAGVSEAASEGDELLAGADEPHALATATASKSTRACRISPMVMLDSCVVNPGIT
jgi:hypothetical protein